MRDRLGAFVLSLGAVAASAALVVAAAARQTAAPASGVTAHEWGTFTSVAGAEGQPVEWAPFTGPQDLPCYVTQLNPFSVKAENFVAFNGTQPGEFLPGLRASVRMETPVIYFYSPVDAVESVEVHLPQGLITEWYPQATVPGVPPWATVADPRGSGWAKWPSVRIRPDLKTGFPSDEIASHYYAARDTDSAPLQVGDQVEKFLFYRGLADFPVKLSVRLDRRGQVAIDRSGAPALPAAILFESDGRRMGFRVLGRVDGGVAIARPELTLDLQSPALRDELAKTLTAAGLFPREASAMIATWKDSWFEPGVRLFYVLPRESVDEVLPLTISPAPAQLARVFVGRVEIITPEMVTAVASLLRVNDVDALAKYGRLLDPISNRVLLAMTTRDEQARATATLRAVAARFAATRAVTARACQ